MPDTITLDLTGIRPEAVPQFLVLAEQLRLESAAPVAAEDDVESTGWTYDLVQTLRADLKDRGHTVQLDAFNAAIYDGGYVSRAKVYELGNYASSRRLTRWTVPVKKSQDWIVQQGLPHDAESAIEPVYGPGTGYRQALGFKVPAEIVQLVWDAENYDGTEVGDGHE